MTQNEMYAACAVIAYIAYSLGRQQAKAVAAVSTYDPMGWLNQYTTA